MPPDAAILWVLYVLCVDPKLVVPQYAACPAHAPSRNYLPRPLHRLVCPQKPIRNSSSPQPQTLNAAKAMRKNIKRFLSACILKRIQKGCSKAEAEAKVSDGIRPQYSIAKLCDLSYS